MQANGTTPERWRHTMLDRILDERLHDQRRYETAFALRVDIALDLQASAQSHSFDIEIAFCQSDLIGQSNALLRAELQRSTQEVRQQNAHPARRSRVGHNECIDGIETVEEKVRINLIPQSLQLGFTRKHLKLERFLLRPLGDLESDEQIVESD